MFISWFSSSIEIQTDTDVKMKRMRRERCRRLDRYTGRSRTKKEPVTTGERRRRRFRSIDALCDPCFRISLSLWSDDKKQATSITEKKEEEEERVGERAEFNQKKNRKEHRRRRGHATGGGGTRERSRTKGE